MRFQGRDVLAMTPEELRALRGDGIAMVFQDPMTSLNPVLRIARQLVETMVVARPLRPASRRPTRAVSLLGRMGITAPERAIHSYPHQFSGGMRQRVMLAMGIRQRAGAAHRRRADHRARRDDPGADPRPDARAQPRFRHRHHPHQPRPRRHRQRVPRVIVMYAGEVVEEGPTEQVLADPRHPYTWALINAVPRHRPAPAGQRAA